MRDADGSVRFRERGRETLTRLLGRGARTPNQSEIRPTKIPLGKFGRKDRLFLRYCPSAGCSGSVSQPLGCKTPKAGPLKKQVAELSSKPTCSDKTKRMGIEGDAPRIKPDWRGHPPPRKPHIDGRPSPVSRRRKRTGADRPRTVWRSRQPRTICGALGGLHDRRLAGGLMGHDPADGSDSGSR